MSKTNEIIAKIEKFAPPCLAEEWDNSGWQIFLDIQEVNKVMIALSPTPDVIEKAVNNRYELLITHHPLFFSGLKSLSEKDYVGSSVIQAIQNHLQIYSAHTNLDAARGGIADVFANMLKLKNILPLQPDNVDKPGRIGEFQQEKSIDLLVKELKTLLNTDGLKVINPSNIEKIRTVSILPGSGGSFIPFINTDLYITGDVKYHDALLADNTVVIDAGHFESERIILPVLKDFLLKEFQLEIGIAEENVPWINL